MVKRMEFGSGVLPVDLDVTPLSQIQVCMLTFSAHSTSATEADTGPGGVAHHKNAHTHTETHTQTDRI